MTHDLIRDLLVALGVTIERVVITDLVDGVFFADLVLRHGDKEYVLSSRPSDAIAIAVRTDVAIFCLPEVLDDGAIEVDELPALEPPADREEVVEEFRAFIESVNPEDFQS